MGKKKKFKKVIEKTEEVLSELKNCSNGIFALVRGLTIDGKDVLGGRCI